MSHCPDQSLSSWEPSTWKHRSSSATPTAAGRCWLTTSIAICTNDPALSAGLFAGECINDRALGMLRHWGINASGHCPRQVDRELCDQASAIFVMAPARLRRLLRFYGEDLDRKTYLFADRSMKLTDKFPVHFLLQRVQFHFHVTKSQSRSLHRRNFPSNGWYHTIQG